MIYVLSVLDNRFVFLILPRSAYSLIELCEDRRVSNLLKGRLHKRLNFKQQITCKSSEKSFPSLDQLSNCLDRVC